MNLQESLKSIYDIDQESYELLISKLVRKTFKKGSYLVKAGDTQRNFYFVSKRIQMAYYENAERQHVINFTYPPFPSAVPESFMLQKPSTYYLMCLTESELDYIPYTSLQQLFDESQAVERLFRKMTEKLLAGIITRYIELHSLTMEEQFRTFTKRSPHLLHLIPHISPPILESTILTLVSYLIQ